MSLLEASGLSVTYGGVRANEDIDLAVPDGALVGLIGPNGAGKTTFLDALTGFAPMSSGSVRFAGEDITHLAPHLRARRGMVRTFQSLQLFEDVSVRDNLLVAAEEPTWRDVVLDVIRPGRPSGVDDAVDAALALVGVEDVAHRLPTELSHGQRILVGVARALAMNPRLLLLDEPAAGLDDGESEVLGQRLRGLVSGGGPAALLVDHDMGLVFGICDFVHVLDFGRVIATGTPAEIRRDPKVLAAYLGSAANEVEDLGVKPPEPESSVQPLDTSQPPAPWGGDEINRGRDPGSQP